MRRISRLQIGLYAANVCYFLVLSLFPGLLLVLAGLRYTALSAMDLILLLEGLVPEALMGAVEKLIVTVYYNAGGTVVSLSAVAAIWSASRGIYGLMAGLNRIYGIPKERGLSVRLISAGYMVLFPGVLVLTLLMHVFGSQLVTWLETDPFAGARSLSQVVDLRLVVLLLVQTGVFALMYAVLPKGRRHPFAGNLPGAAAAALGWQLFSRLFSLYVGAMGEYTLIYGDIFVAAMGMLWLYCCTVILLLGGALNRFLWDATI